MEPLNTNRREGLTVVELMVGLALTALIMGAVVTAMHATLLSHTSTTQKGEMVTRARGVLDRLTHDIRHADTTLVADTHDALNVLVVKPGGERVWRQYRRTWDSLEGGWVLKTYQDTAGIPLPPETPGSEVASEILARNVKVFDVQTLVTSTRSVTETLSCRVTTCEPAPAGQYIIPFKEGPYVLKLSQTQFDEIGLEEGVDQPIDPRHRYEEDDDPDTYWLCLEDCQSPSTYYEPWADWDFEDVLIKATESSDNVDLEVFSGNGGYQWDILGPDGTVLWENLSGSNSYSYVPYAIDSDTVRIQLEIEEDGISAGATTTATQRRHVF